MRSYILPYRVQSFTTGINDAEVKLTIRAKPSYCAKPPCAEHITTYTKQHYNLALQEARSGIFQLGSINSFSEYTLEIQVHPLGLATDNFARNNKKVFKFKTGMGLAGISPFRPS